MKSAPLKVNLKQVEKRLEDLIKEVQQIRIIVDALQGRSPTFPPIPEPKE